MNGNNILTSPVSLYEAIFDSFPRKTSLGQTHICFEILGLVIALDGVQIEPNVDFYCVGKGIISHVQTTSSNIFGSSADPTES